MKKGLREADCIHVAATIFQQDFVRKTKSKVWLVIDSLLEVYATNSAAHVDHLKNRKKAKKQKDSRAVVHLCDMAATADNVGTPEGRMLIGKVYRYENL